MRNCLRKVLSNSALLLLLAGFLFESNSIAQEGLRPTIIDSGEVKVSRSQPRINKPKPVSGQASTAANSILIVRTEPEDCEISINGRTAGRAVNGTFTKELPSRKQYSIVVAAGPDYEPYTQVVTLKPRLPEVVDAPLTSRFGIVKVFPYREGLKLFVNDQPASAAKLKVDAPNETISISALPPGEHKITYDLPDHVIYTRKFTVSPGTEHNWNLIPKLAVTDLTVATDPETTVYVDGEPLGATPEDGILRNGNIRLGSHEVKLVKDDYEEFKTSLKFEFGKPVRIDQKLTPVPTSAEFSENFGEFNTNRWAMPGSGWSASAGRLAIEGSMPLAIPKNLHYRNFEMHFHLRLRNDGGAAWAVRVKDPNNYYLFYLRGPRGNSPAQFITYVVKDGKFNPSDYANAVDVVTDLKSDAQYEVHIKATKNEIWHTIVPAQTGAEENLGYFKDPGNFFPYGSIGFRSIASERFSVDDLFVQPRP